MRSYPSIYNLGHRAVRELTTRPHYIEEKVDGSQCSFGLFPVEREPSIFPATAIEELHEVQVGSEAYVLRFRSKGAEMLIDAPEKMFSKAVESVKERQHLLTPGYTYRGEYLRQPKHNTLAYDRTPHGHIIIFDVDKGDNDLMGPEEKRLEAARIGLECVPTLLSFIDHMSTLEHFRTILDGTTSVLGGQKIEGIVVKQYGPDYLYGQDKKILIGKFVSEVFKEAHKAEWKNTSPNSGDILASLGKQFCHPGRWMKAVQHLRDAGTLTDSPKDIGPLLIEVQKDLGKEEKENIQKALWKWAGPHIMRAATRGFPEWYKDQLLRLQFETDCDAGDETGPGEHQVVLDAILEATVGE